MDVLERIKDHYGFAPGSSFVNTHIDSVRFFWSTEPVERAPLIYSAGFVIVLQGHKIGYLEDRIFHYNPEQYLVLSVPIAFECATFASEESPLLGLFIDIDMNDLSEILSVIPRNEAPPLPSSSAEELGIRPVMMKQAMRNALERLLDTLCSPEKSRILGPGILKEVLYASLSEDHESVLRALLSADAKGDRISRAIRIMRENYGSDLSIGDLAAQTGMSLSVFHRAFKAVTGVSPHRYLKTTRLHRAKGMMLAGGRSVSETAELVGYGSAAHFSREFKKHFGVAPKDAGKGGYAPVDV